MLGQKRAWIAVTVASCALATVLVHSITADDSHAATPNAATPNAAASSTDVPNAAASSPTETTTVAPTSSPTPTRSPSSTSTRTPAPEAAASVPDTKALTARLTQLFGAGNSFSVAALDLSTGQSVTAGANSGMTEASVVKLDILETAIYQSQQGESFDQADAEEMMEQSDNVAADQVFQGIGGNSALEQYNSLIGLTSTTLDPDGVWGLSVTSASDQLKLMRALVSASSPLNAASRQYALQLMGDVEADQDWGVSAAADSGAPTELKNGWLNIDSDNGLWAVNSAGLTTVSGDPVLLVVLSQHQPDYQTGVDRVEAGAQLLAKTLTS